MQPIDAKGAELYVNGEKVDDWAEEKPADKRVALYHAGRGSAKATLGKAFAANGFGGQTVSKAEMIKTLRKALEASGHTKERARVLAKEHYKRYINQINGG